MKKLLLVVAIVTAVGGSSLLTYAGFEEEFQKSTDINLYRKGIEDIETALLIKNATSALHNENMEILKKLEKIEKRLSALEERLKRLR